MKTNFKKVLCAFLVVVMCLTMAPLQGFVGMELPEIAPTAKAASYLTSGYCGDTSDGGNEKDIYWELSEDGVLTLSGTGKIVREAFIYDLRIKEVIISNGITNISDYCFSNCDNLEKIVFGKNVEIIGANAFYDCDALTDITLPESMLKIDDNAFYHCSRLTTVGLNTNLQSIGKNAFYYSIKLSAIDFPASLQSIGEYAFYECHSLKSIDIPEGISVIEEYTFYNCHSLTEINLPDSLIKIGQAAFMFCSSLKGIDLPEGLQIISSSAFARCFKLESIVIPDSTKTICIGAFSLCKSMVNIHLGSGVESFSLEVFDSCAALESITVSEDNPVYASVDGVLYNKAKTVLLLVPNAIDGEFTLPGTVEEFAYTAVENCSKLTAINVEEGSSFYKSVDGIVYTADGKTLVVCPRGKNGTVTVSDGTETIGAYSFNSCYYITAISFPDGLKNIGNFSFAYCSNITELEFPSSLMIIDEYAFASCTALADINFAEGLQSINNRAFCRCSSLTDIHLPDSLVKLGDSVFSEDKKLSAVFIGASVSSISITAFLQCKALTEITVSENNNYYTSVDGVVYTKAKDDICVAPEGLSGEVTLPAQLKSFDFTDMRSCYNLTAIYVEEGSLFFKSVDGIVYTADGKTLIICPRGKTGSVAVSDGTEKIDMSAFSSCSFITSVSLPEGVLTLESQSFISCTSLTDVSLPESLLSIGQQAFHGCTSLANINLPDGLQSIGIKAFNSCSALTGINVPANITTIKDDIFFYCGFKDLVLPETVQSFNHTGWSKLETLTIKNRYCEYNSVNSPLLNKECVIRAYCGSPGHQLAVKQLLDFESMGHTHLDWYVYQPATYEADGIMRRDCAYCDSYEEKVIPKLVDDVFTATFVADGEVVATVDFPKGTTQIAEPKVPAKDRYMGEWEDYTLNDADITINAIYTLIKSDDASEIETDSEVIHYTDKDDVLFRFRTWADALVVKSTVSKSVPLDIVLVVDQSGSMEDTLGSKTKKVDALKETATDFVNTVFENAKITQADHRISIVGFGLSGTYQGFEKNENTELLTSANGIVKFDDIRTADYASSLLQVNVEGNVNEALLTAIDSIAARGATAADLGFEMAKGVFANSDSEGRQRVVIFMTDGEPTYLNGFQTSVANAAIYNASLLKNAYDASVYSVGVFANTSKNINTFMNAVSSGYPDAVSMTSLGNGTDGQYYITVNNTDALTGVFKTISTESLSHTAPFDNLTLIKTLSENVTLTSKQEEQLRVDLIRKYSITNNDIIISRNDDGTTTIQINSLTPYEVLSEDGSVYYEVEVEFFASLNEKTAEAGDYVLDTEDSGVMLGSDAKGYEATFATSTITLSSSKTRVIFTINGDVYDISENISNGYAVAPEIEISEDWVFSGWDTNSQKASNGLVFDATITKALRTVIWHTADGDITQNYHKGDIITAPEVGMTANGEAFLSWDRSIPTTMPDENLEFTAVYGAHVHNYSSEVTKKMTCTEDGIRTFTCVCSDTYNEVITAIGHNYEAITPSLEKEDAKCTFCCTNCGDKYDYALEYEVVEATGKKTRVLYEFNLTDDELNTDIQPDGEIQIRIPLSEIHSSAENVTVIRTNEDGSKTQVPAYHENGFLVIICDHFTPYEVIFDISCEAHIQGEWIVEKEATCTQQGYHYALCTECEKIVFEETIEKTEHTFDGGVCTSCGEDKSVNCAHMCHQSGFMGFIWKIVQFFWKLFNMNPVCECGAAHY